MDKLNDADRAIVIVPESEAKRDRPNSRTLATQAAMSNASSGLRLSSGE